MPKYLQFKHYYPTAGKMIKDLLAEGGEPAIPSVAKFLDRATELSVLELTQLYSKSSSARSIHTAKFSHLLTTCRDQRQYQIDYLALWNATARMTSTGKPIDVLLTPAMASASFPHDYLP